MPDYTLGPSTYRKPYARFETKAGDGSGAGYERWRSTEWRPHTARQDKEDVYVPHHRLLYLISDELVDVPIDEAIAALDGNDVHHRNGGKWDNRLERREAEDGVYGDDAPASNLELLEHGTHSEVTQAEMRAWAETDRERAFGDDPFDEDLCDHCGDPMDTAATCPAWPGEERCISCAMETADGETIDL